MSFTKVIYISMFSYFQFFVTLFLVEKKRNFCLVLKKHLFEEKLKKQLEKYKKNEKTTSSNF